MKKVSDWPIYNVSLFTPYSNYFTEGECLIYNLLWKDFALRFLRSGGWIVCVTNKYISVAYSVHHFNILRLLTSVQIKQTRGYGFSFISHKKTCHVIIWLPLSFLIWHSFIQKNVSKNISSILLFIFKKIKNPGWECKFLFSKFCLERLVI